MDPLDNNLENISDRLLNYLSNSCRKPINPAGIFFIINYY